MNNFFSSIGSELGKSCGNQDQDPSDFRSNPFHKTFYLTPVSVPEILKLINEMDPKKSNQPDDPPTKFIKTAKHIIAPILTKLINISFEQGKFPDILKIATVIPIHKSGDKQKPGNYRPISLISPFSKLLEKCLYKRMDDFLIMHSLIHPSQHGFRKGISTETAVSKIYNILTTDIEKERINCSIFLDIRKAFDSVNHTILIRKLYNYGFRGITLDLLKSFLLNRYQTVYTNGTKSTLRPMTCGVPQGSSLGPLLFILFINDLPLSSNFQICLFADDACLSMSDPSIFNLETRVNLELAKISQWFRSNKLCLNYDKTVFMLINNKRQDNSTKFKVCVQGNHINEVKKVKYLGVIFDAKLTWNAHIEKVTNSISKGCWAIARLKPYVNIPTLRTVYYSLIYPHLQYCIICWGSAAQTHLNKIITKHKMAIRIITGSGFMTHTRPLFHQLKLLKIQDIHKLNIAVYIKRLILNNQLSSVQLSLSRQIHQHGTRRNLRGDIEIPQSRTNKAGIRAIPYQGATTWNEVPTSIRDLPIHLFKGELRDSYISAYDPQN
jgi:hypothetical protein